MSKVKIPYKNIVTESVDDIGSVALGIYFNYGSSNENNRFAGYSHFLEHMFFKGTKTKSSKDISSTVESVGGYINGYTNHRNIAIVSRVPKFAVESVLDLYDDILKNSKFTKNDIEVEKRVVIEEINSAKDEPEDYLYEAYMQSFWKDTPYNKPIAGFVDNVENITQDSFFEFLEIVLNRQRVFSIAGNLSDLNNLSNFKSIASSFGAEYDLTERLNFVVGEKLEKFSSVQSHNLLGTMIYTANDLYTKMILFFINTMFMEGMSSILFQLLREKHGLVYDLYPIMEDFGAYTNYSIYFSSKMENRDKVLNLIFEEFNNYIESGFEQKDLQYFKNFYKGNLLLNFENSYSRMSLNAQDYLKYERIISITERFELLEKIKIDDINQFMKRNFVKDKFSIYSLTP